MSRTNLKSLSTRIAQIATAASIIFAPAAYAQIVAAKLELNAPAVAATGQSAASLYAEGLVRRAAGDESGAFQAFLEAATAGHARAQRHLGEIYDSGNGGVHRDLMESIRWYQKAREQGEQISQPSRRTFGFAAPSI
jgi:TPR repeat protein